MYIICIPIVLGVLIGILPVAGRRIAVWSAVVVFAFPVVILIGNWNAMFAGLDLLFAIACPFIVIVSASAGYVQRVICEEVTV